MEISQKTKNRTTIQPSNSTLGNIYKKNKTKTNTVIQKDLCTPNVALFIIAKIWTQLGVQVCVCAHTHTHTHTQWILPSHTKNKICHLQQRG